MITVTVGEQKPEAEKPFPKLMQHDDGTIVLFENRDTGVCIVPGGATKQFFYSSSWGSVWKDYNEPITIQNA